jgi:hypothetical protein
LKVIKDPEIFTFSSWKIMDVRITGEKTVDIDKLKSITEYDFDESH